MYTIFDDMEYLSSELFKEFAYTFLFLSPLCFSLPAMLSAFFISDTFFYEVAQKTHLEFRLHVQEAW